MWPASSLSFLKNRGKERKASKRASVTCERSSQAARGRLPTPALLAASLLACHTHGIHAHSDESRSRIYLFRETAHSLDENCALTHWQILREPKRPPPSSSKTFFCRLIFSGDKSLAFSWQALSRSLRTFVRPLVMPSPFFRLLSNAFSHFGSVGRKKKKNAKKKLDRSLELGGPVTQHNIHGARKTQGVVRKSTWRQ